MRQSKPKRRSKGAPLASVHRLRLVEDDAARDDTMALLTRLLLKTQRGDITGIVCIVKQPGREYEVLRSGSFRNNPTFTVGALHVAANSFLPYTEN